MWEGGRISKKLKQKKIFYSRFLTCFRHFVDNRYFCAFQKIFFALYQKNLSNYIPVIPRLTNKPAKIITGIFFIKDGETLVKKWLLINPKLSHWSFRFLVAEVLINKTRFKLLFKGATDLKLQRMYRVDKKKFVVLKEIGRKKENLTVFIKKSFFIEFRCRCNWRYKLFDTEKSFFPLFLLID